MVGSNKQAPQAVPKGGDPSSQAGGAVGQAKPLPDANVNDSFGMLSRFFKDDVSSADIKVDESAYHIKHQNLVRLIRRQSLAILLLVFIVIIGSILLQPVHSYFVKWPAPDNKVQELVSLTEPNLTDQAILSWAATSITEILTFGFGDIDQRLVSQSNRFTSEGWDSFVGVLRDQNLREEFKMRQLVLTTVPANSPVIVGKGLDEDGDYTWVVEMPVIRTYSTNNSVTSGKKGIIRLTIARIPSLVNNAGIGIKMWKEM